ncbi:beta-carotene 15,15'-dioxygenase [Rhodococcoides trifolii]|uniref:Probable beta-carotene 15,15'-dioxygenase n=1 Tax=Rhodococcoides trifolii TaxID=908250 RepID=A0A917CM90_9NOCA|nr:Brp/Blh family beta-carotene 15,15'-dioxygenase [Rhodococcus trifolii]GGF92553.1 beta-carotene 15,15'-dioxygenase [Rhodococcus trifolii]
MAIPSAEKSTYTFESVSDGDAAAIRARLLVPVLVAFVLLTAVCAVTPIPLLWQYVPFALSLVVLGLPHGALDHLVPAWLDRRGQSLASIARVVALYGVLAGATALLWMWVPTAAAIAFVALTWFHWGQGDLYALVAINDSRYLDTAPLRCAAVVSRGGLPMLIPLVFHPESFHMVLGASVSLFDRAGPTSTPLDDPTLRTVLAGSFIAFLVATALVTRRRCTAGDRRAWWRDQAEVVALLIFFVVVPPILAVGLYFSLWHALRHFVRLDSIGSVNREPLRTRVWDLARGALPTTAAAIVLLVVMAVALPGAHDTGGAALGVYLVLISALTVPHVAVVSYMDYRQQLWRPVRSVR